MYSRLDSLTGGQSQWSLTFEVRKRGRRCRDLRATQDRSQWSLTFEVRKRDLPTRLASASTACRNGA